MTNEPKFKREKSRKSKSDNDNFENETDFNNFKPDLKCEQCVEIENT